MGGGGVNPVTVCNYAYSEAVYAENYHFIAKLCFLKIKKDFSKMLIENLRKLSEKNAFRLTGQRAQCLADISS